MSPNDAFVYNRLAHYVWALSQKWPSARDGYDVRYMVKGYEQYHQIDLDSLKQLLMDEISQDALHQKWWWLRVDGCIETIAMLQSDGNLIDGMPSRATYDKQMEGRKLNGYTTRIKSNVERVKNSYRNASVAFEARPENPELMADAISSFNAFTRKTLEINNFESQKENYIHDGVAFGSGVMQVHHDATRGIPDDTWFEEKIRQGVPLDYNEYKTFLSIARSHIVESVDTFEIIRDRHARGRDAASFDNAVHTRVTRVRKRPLAYVQTKYPDKAHLFSPNITSIYQYTNPSSLQDPATDYHVIEYEVQICCPVRYDLEYNVMLGPGVSERVSQKRERNAIVKVVFFECAGIVDMCIDEYAHNRFTYQQWMHTPSYFHGCGIGLAKYGRDTERILNIMMSGQLRFFDRMSKGGGWFYSNVIDEATVQKRAREGTYIGIDYSKLPAELKNRPISDLVMDNRPTTMPVVYDQLMNRAEEYTNRAMMVPDAARGIKQGSSGRQELILTNQAEEVINSGIAAYEMSYHGIGLRLHANIVDIEADTEMSFFTEDRYGKPQTIELNKPEGELLEFDPIEQTYKAVPVAIKNSLRTLRFDTALVTRPVIPTNPAQLSLFYRGLAESLLPFIQMGPTGLVFVDFLNRYAYNDIPGLGDMIKQLRDMAGAQLEQEQEMMGQQQQQQAEREAFDQAVQKAELSQNQMRLMQNFVANMAKNNK